MIDNDTFLEGLKKQVDNEAKDMKVRVVKDNLWCFFNKEMDKSGVKFGANYRKSNSYVGIGGGLAGCNFHDLKSSSSPLFQQEIPPDDSPLTNKTASTKINYKENGKNNWKVEKNKETH